MNKVIYIIAGPNGAGKTTFALTSLKKVFGIDEFVNADEIAKGLSPLNPESVSLSAGKIMLERITKLVNEERSFAFETTLAGKNYIKHIATAKKKGYQIVMFFLWLNSAEIAVNRVKERVKNGGHNVPETRVRKRYKSGLNNYINLYLKLADLTYLIDNTDYFEDFLNNLIIEKTSTSEIKVYNQEVWDKINGTN